MQIVIVLLCLAGCFGAGWLVGYGLFCGWKAFLSFIADYVYERRHR